MSMKPVRGPNVVLTAVAVVAAERHHRAGKSCFTQAWRTHSCVQRRLSSRRVGVLFFLIDLQNLPIELANDGPTHLQRVARSLPDKTS